MFLSAVAGEKTTPNFFPAKTAQMSVGKWCSALLHFFPCYIADQGQTNTPPKKSRKSHLNGIKTKELRKQETDAD